MEAVEVVARSATDIRSATAPPGTGMLGGDSWDSCAAAGSIFQTSPFLLSWWQDRVDKCPDARLITVQVLAEGNVVGICAFEWNGSASDAGSLRFAGGPDVVDYMGPVALDGREELVAAALTRWIFEELPWSRLRLAGLAHDDRTARALLGELARTSPGAVVAAYDQAPRIEAAPAGYLASLNAKRRADVLRKRRLLSEAVGELELAGSTPATVGAAIERLLAWKAGASPATAEFVAEYGGFVRSLVTGLAAVDAAQVVELRAAGRPLASAIMLRHRDTAYLYNMSYDLGLAADGGTSLAPGVVLVSLLVEQSLDQGLRFDFLKGSQDYKLRLGGVPVDLVEVTIER